MARSIPGASVWEQGLYDHLVDHVDAEQEVLGRYLALSEDQTAAPAVRYIATMIVQDEVRHHDTFRDLADAIRRMGELSTDDPPIPSLRGLHADADRIIALADSLLEVERGDAHELRSLSKDLHDVSETTLLGLLVDVMRRDTDKHIMMLKFLRARAYDAKKATYT